MPPLYDFPNPFPAQNAATGDAVASGLNAQLPPLVQPKQVLQVPPSDNFTNVLLDQYDDYKPLVWLGIPVLALVSGGRPPAP